MSLACGAARTPDGTGRVWLAIRGTPDTLRFEVPVVAQRCGPGRGLLIHGQREGQGVLVWLHGSGAPEAGTYPLVSRSDTMTTPGAIAAVRFLIDELASGITIDEGSVAVSRAVPPFALRVRGSGVGSAFSQQRQAEVDLAGVPLRPDTVPCRVEP